MLPSPPPPWSLCSSVGSPELPLPEPKQTVYWQLRGQRSTIPLTPPHPNPPDTLLGLTLERSSTGLPSSLQRFPVMGILVTLPPHFLLKAFVVVGGTLSCCYPATEVRQHNATLYSIFAGKRQGGMVLPASVPST